MERYKKLALVPLKITVDLPTGNILKTKFLTAYAFCWVAQVILLGNYKKEDC